MSKAGLGRLPGRFAQNPLARYLQNRLTPVFLLVITLLFSVLLSILTSFFVTNQQRARFEREADLFDSLLLRRMETYQGSLYSVRALWTSDMDITSRSYREYAADLKLPERYPGVLGIGFMRWLRQGQQAAFEQQMRREVPGFVVRPPVQGVGAPIAYLEPHNRFLDALGANAYASVPRREAMLAALKTHQPQISLPLTLEHVQKKERGVILFLDVYRSGQLYGFAYLPVSLTQLFGSLTRDKGDLLSTDVQSQLNIEVFDGAQRLYGVPASHAVFTAVRQLPIAGRTWKMRYSASESFGRDAASNLPMLVLGLGTLVALSAYFSYLAQTRARLHAEQVSESLRVSRSKLERSRAEFESIFRSMADSAIFTDLSGRILFANNALSQRFGYDLQQLRGQHISLLRADDRLQEVAAGGSTAVSTLFNTRSGEQFYGELQRNLVVSETGQKLGYLEVVHDLSSRRATEQALRASEQRYRGVLESMPQMVWLTTPGGQHTYFNQRWQDYVGAATTQALLAGGAPAAEGLIELVHPDDRLEFARRWRHAHVSGQPFEMEHRLLGAEQVGAGQIGAGQVGAQVYRTFMTRSEAVRGAGGELLEWVSTATDIDDQVFSEWSSRLLAGVSKQLTGSDSLPAGALQHAAVLSENVALRSTLRLMNERLAVFSAIWTVPPLEDLPPDERGALLSPAANQEPVREPLQEATQVSSAMGQTATNYARRTAFTRSVLSQVRGHIRETALLGHPNVQRVVTQARYLAEPVVLEDPGLQVGGLSGLVVVLLTAERPGPVEYFPASYLVLGFRQPIRVRELEVVQELAGRLSAYLEGLRLTQEVRYSQQALQELNASLEERVAERTAELAEANRELETFSYSVSHDLRAPLRHMTSFSDLLHKELLKEAAQSPEGAPNKKVERYLGIIMGSGQRMGQLIDDLLEFSRTSRQPLNMQRVDLQRLIADVQSELALTDPGSRATWHLGEFGPVSADPSLLRQVFVNLLGNAAKYSAKTEHPEIWVDAQLENHEVVVSVRDNGVGFDPKYADKLFGVFQRLHRPEDFEGSGIGLANVRRIVTRHGGRVWATGAVGEGATFFVSLRPYEA